jgi:hypothetical protein
MMNYKKQKMVSVPEPKLAKDPRSATVSNGAVNYIVQPEKVAVRGTKRMLPEKKKTASVV